MDNNITNEKDERGVGLHRLMSVLLKKSWVIVTVSILCALIVLAVTIFFVTPSYQSSAMFYVNNNNFTLGETSVSISSGDLTTSRSLVDSYIVILNTRETLNDVIDYSGSTRTYQELKSMIEASSVNETEIFEVTVTSEDPQEAQNLANAIAYILPKRIDSTIEGTSARIVDAAVLPVNPSSPNRTLNAVIGFAIGFLLAVTIIVLQELFDITIRSEEDMKQVCEYPVLTMVPDMGAPSKGSYYYYGYGSKRRGGKKKAFSTHGKDTVLFGSEISFAAAEAYKLLRTKLQFSFADESSSRVIGVSSALSGEGKSLSAINLAYSLSQLNKKVVLVDCDMRRPTLSEKLKIRKQPGLSGYLTGQHQLGDLIQKSGLSNDEESFEVITAGQNPPNPIELLSSERMTKFLRLLRQSYDYIILDLPPVGEVSDAMAVAKETDGMLLVVRQNYCDRLVLKDTIHQFAFIEAKILGVVYNCATDNGGRYSKRYYKKYYNRNSKKYEGAYLAAERRAAKSRTAESRAPKAPTNNNTQNTK